MLVLGIETSCDETAAAGVVDGRQILSSVVASQIDVHSKFGGVVPELASRTHIQNIVPVILQALDDAGVPNILLEVEEQLPSDAQLKTRFETFVDMID